MSELLNLYGKTDNTNATGTFPLDSEWFDSASGTSGIKVDKGMKAKLWILELSGVACEALVEQSIDGGTSWEEIKRVDLASEGTLELDKRRPIIITARNDQTHFRISWSQPTVGLSYIDAIAEMVSS